jgi:hypothetical protein
VDEVDEEEEVEVEMEDEEEEVEMEDEDEEEEVRRFSFVSFSVAKCTFLSLPSFPNSVPRFCFDSPFSTFSSSST